MRSSSILAILLVSLGGTFTYAADAGSATHLVLGADGKLLVGGFVYRSPTYADAVVLHLE